LASTASKRAASYVRDMKIQKDRIHELDRLVNDATKMEAEPVRGALGLRDAHTSWRTILLHGE